MKFYHATIQVNSDAPSPEEDNVALLRMELLFSIGDRATHVPVGKVVLDMKSVPTTAGDIVKSTLSDLRLTPYMQIREIEEITQEEAERYAS